MMLGAGRARLLVDWNIGLLFGRDTADLGGLGPPRTVGGRIPSPGVGAARDDAAAEASTRT